MPGRPVFARALYDGERWRREVRVTPGPCGSVAAIARGGPERGDREVGVLIPGLVNAHVHLDLGPLPGAPRSFPGWLRAVLASRRAHGPGAVDSLAEANLAACLRRGATVFGDIDGSGAGRRALARRGVVARSYAEVVGFDLGPEAARARVAAALDPPGGRVEPGLSPHAPYSVSPDLIRAARATGCPLAIHLSETADEVRFLEDGGGPLRDLLEDLGRCTGSFRPPRCSPLAWVDRLGCRGRDVLLVHMQILLPGDLDLLARSGNPVVVCPGTIEWFGRPAPDVPAMVDAGILLALGTDSVASNARLDMFREMALLRRLCPGVDPARVLRMATADGAHALGLDAGRIAAGLRFDAVGLEDGPSDDEEELAEWLTAGEPAIRVVLMGGSPCDRDRRTL